MKGSESKQLTAYNLYFGALYCTGARIGFIDWLYGTECIGIVAMQVSKDRRRKSLGHCCLRLAKIKLLKKPTNFNNITVNIC